LQVSIDPGYELLDAPAIVLIPVTLPHHPHLFTPGLQVKEQKNNGNHTNDQLVGGRESPHKGCEDACHIERMAYYAVDAISDQASSWNRLWKRGEVSPKRPYADFNDCSCSDYDQPAQQAQPQWKLDADDPQHHHRATCPRQIILSPTSTMSIPKKGFIIFIPISPLAIKYQNNSINISALPN
jgi:hypothetical protein